MDEKKWITEKIEDIHSYTIEGPLSDLIKGLQKIFDEYTNKGFINLRLEDATDYDETSTRFGLYGDRIETDREFEKRLEKTKKDKERQAKYKERDKERRAIQKQKEQEGKRTLYEKLKAEFEGERNEKT